MTSTAVNRSIASAFDADLPPQCPKCGCHRVRVVGQPPQSALRFMRCEECESTSALLTRRRA
jgi:transposase-like protein